MILVLNIASYRSSNRILCFWQHLICVQDLRFLMVRNHPIITSLLSIDIFLVIDRLLWINLVDKQIEVLNDKVNYSLAHLFLFLSMTLLIVFSSKDVRLLLYCRFFKIDLISNRPMTIYMYICILFYMLNQSAPNKLLFRPPFLFWGVVAVDFGITSFAATSELSSWYVQTSKSFDLV